MDDQSSYDWFKPDDYPMYEKVTDIWGIGRSELFLFESQIGHSLLQGSVVGVGNLYCTSYDLGTQVTDLVGGE